MSKKERVFLVLTLIGIFLLVSIDLMTDSDRGVSGWHIIFEGTAAVAALIGVFALLKDSFKLKREIENERRDFTRFKTEAEQWRNQSQKYISGLSQAIDDQLKSWALTTAEKEIALLLLKGLSLKEIAEVRNTSEKTTQAQSLSIYSKSGLAGRSELSAFFLEDLLMPTELK